jgi:DNA polymerase
MYHGAGTGRWAGKVVQLQNLPSRGLGKLDGTDIAEALHVGRTERVYKEPSVSAALSSAIRGMFLSTLGYKLVVADYSAIEARGVMWLANDKVGLKMFSDSDAGRGPEVYVQMARMLYGDETITKENASAKRDLGKQTILGCGYQMGVDRFLDTCIGYGMDVSRDMAEKAVQFYRERFYDVVRMWTAQERAAMAAMKGQKVRCGRVVWYHKDKWLVCVLPSGREMAYFKPEISTKEGRAKLSYVTIDSQTKQSLRKDMYGGLIVENICQATARDIMAWAMVRVHRAGYKVLFTVHDEIVAEHPKPDMDEFIKIMTEIPPWAEGFPIKASGWISERYKKG